MRRVLGWTIALGVAMSLGAGMALIAGYQMVTRAPDWWRQVDPGDPMTIRIGEAIENAIVTQLHRVERETDEAYEGSESGAWRSREWAFAITASDANAWLNTRLPKWLQDSEPDLDWPRAVHELQVDFDEALIRVGVLLRGRGGERQIVSATLTPELREDGSLWMRAAWVHIGRLPVPASWVLDQGEVQTRRHLGEQAAEVSRQEALFRVFAGDLPAMEDASVRLGDGRRVRIMRLQPRRGRLEVVCRTEFR